MARDIKVIWVKREGKYFCKWGWTANSLICPSGKSPPPVSFVRDDRDTPLVRQKVSRCPAGLRLGEGL
jgi:hypothetical protein